MCFQSMLHKIGMKYRILVPPVSCSDSSREDSASAQLADHGLNQIDATRFKLSFQVGRELSQVFWGSLSCRRDRVFQYLARSSHLRHNVTVFVAVICTTMYSIEQARPSMDQAPSTGTSTGSRRPDECAALPMLARVSDWWMCSDQAKFAAPPPSLRHCQTISAMPLVVRCEVLEVLK